MFKSLVYSGLLLLSTSMMMFAESVCCDYPSADISIGYRKDQLDWKVRNVRSSYNPSRSKSHILYKNIDSYNISGNLRYAASDYYIRFSADYGWTNKGSAQERFCIKSPLLCHPVSVETHDPVKRRSEVYDFNGAVGYPFVFYNCRLNIIPLIGFSYHRQHLGIKGEKHSLPLESSAYPGSYFYWKSESYFYDYYNRKIYSSLSDHSSFDVDSSNHFRRSRSSDPFSKHSDRQRNIASELGLKNRHNESNYRFTWYGFYLGTDINYALDNCWTLFSQLELHFLDRCNRKRKSWTGVYCIDHYHKKESAYGFNGTVGVTYAFNTNWYTTVSIDFKYWNSDSHNDNISWKSASGNIGIGYMF